MTRPRLVLPLAVLGCLLLSPAGQAQQTARTVRIGWISVGSPGSSSPFLDAFCQGLSDLGYVEGRNLVIEARWAEGTVERVPELAADLLRSRVDVIMAQGPVVRLLKGATGATPVVFGFSGDPVEAGLVASLARPGGTMTGMTFMSLELVGKRLELLKEAFPGRTRIAILANPFHAGEQSEFKASQEAARRLGLMVQYYPVRSAKDFEDAFGAMSLSGAEAIVAFPDALVMTQSNAPPRRQGARAHRPAVPPASRR